SAPEESPLPARSSRTWQSTPVKRLRFTRHIGGNARAYVVDEREGSHVEVQAQALARSVDPGARHGGRGRRRRRDPAEGRAGTPARTAPSRSHHRVAGE